MERNRFSILIAAVLILTAVIVTPLVGCKGEVSGTTASLSEATMCKNVNPQTQAPIEKLNVFPPDTETFYCSVKLSNAPADTQVLAQWIFLQGEVEEKNVLIDEVTVTTEGTRYISFSLTHDPGTLWLRGDYAVKLFIDGKEKLTVPFKVQ